MRQLVHRFHWKVAFKWLGGFLALNVLFLGFLYWWDSPPSNPPMGEEIDPGEVYVTQRIIAAAIRNSSTQRSLLLQSTPNPVPTSTQTAPGYNPSIYRRDAHPKAHGCANATFTVHRDLPASVSRGIFEKPATYPAILRFSAGKPNISSDTEKDARGVALKLYNVPGSKLLEEFEPENTADFVMMTNPVFFIRTLEGYARFNDLLPQGEHAAFGYFIGFRNPLTWHLRELYLGRGTQKPSPPSLVTTRYYSASAYALGPNSFVKYSLIPDKDNKPKSETSDYQPQRSFDRLRLELARQATTGGASFRFAVQLQRPDKNMPVEDTTVEWKESDSSFISVATLTLVKTPDANTAAANHACEALSFNPWNTLADHRPVGVMNRVRKALYLAMSRFRIEKNCQIQCAERCVDPASALCADCRKACPPDPRKTDTAAQ